MFGWFIGRNKGFQPNTLPNLQLWLDATRIDQADNTAVATWQDQSGNAYNAEQSTSAARPTYRTNQLNGLPAVVFDGTDDVLTIPSSTATFKFLHSDVSTVFIVARAGSVADPLLTYGFIGNATGTSNIGYHIRYIDTALNNDRLNFAVYKGVSGQVVANDTTPNNSLPANTYVFFSAVSDPANPTAAERLKTSINGGTERKANTQTETISTSDASHNLQIGTIGNNASYLNGAICEIIVYNRALSTSELAQVHRYLARKWGIALA